MALTPIDVQQKTFATAMRGYDLDEVDDFLDNVVISLKDYEQRLRDAQERITTLESELNQRTDQESAISRALVAAQRSADSLIEDAREEARRIVAEAESEASELEGQRDEQRRELEDEIEAIRSRLERLRTGVATMLTSISVELDDVERFVDGQEAGVDDTDTHLEGDTIDDASEVGSSAENFDAVEEVEMADASVVEPMDVSDVAEADDSVPEKIVIDGSEELDEDDDHVGWDDDDSDHGDDQLDESFEGSPALDEISEKIDSAFGDLDDDDGYEDDGGYDDGDDEDGYDDDQDADVTPLRPWED